ncbi:Ig-like domain-containing protein [Streptomyces sp. NBC_01142]|uniref:L,D-transpeptidase n=1 Tax=Streptomyces sp. NBC_01142 TaxID=2975865 RepID=UPI002256F3DC|nr:Ig-like domain-containing protein [Streptomyces sp. NBC_01142]MCX4820306.1 Ig-like domain-containing protein [Streptomyces sp. NBC_01142]
MSRIRPRTPLRRSPARFAATAGVVVLSAALTACSGGGAEGGSAGGGGSKKQTSISVNLSGKQAKAGGPVKVTLADGRLKEVTVTDSKGAGLDGSISADGRSWTSARKAAPGTSYSVEAKDADGGSATADFATAAPDKVNKLTLVPGKNSTVGIGQPLSIVFDHPVKNRAEVEKSLKVTTSDKTEGSWGWMQDWSGKDRVDWRPKEYWKPGTKVTLDAGLNGIDSGSGGGWFVRDYTSSFTIGRNQLVRVDLDNHRLKLLRDGAEIKDVPMSAGTPGGEKASWRGRTVLMSKEGTINMRSETVGLGDAYDKMVDYSMRLTWSGMYAHAAPWNAGYFGTANKSSGCVGMSDADAQWIYEQVQVGDPFEISGGDAKGTQALNNGYGEWNLSWSQWQAKSALHS